MLLGSHVPLPLHQGGSWRASAFNRMPRDLSAGQGCDWPCGLISWLQWGPATCLVFCCLPVSVCTLLPEYQASPPDHGDAQLPRGVCRSGLFLLHRGHWIFFLLQMVENGAHPQHESSPVWGGLHHPIACLQQISRCQ